MSAIRAVSSSRISAAVATPDVVSIVFEQRRENASTSGAAMNSAIVALTSSRSCAGAPRAARTAASASAPRLTICDAIASSRVPPAVSVIALPSRTTS